MRQPQRHTPQVPEIRLQGPRRGVDSGTLRPTRSPVGHLSGGELRMEGFSAEPPGLAQHPWQRQQGEKGMLFTRFLLVKPATAKPPSFPSTRLFDRRISRLPDRDVGQLQAPHARCTCRAPKDPSTHIPRCSWQLHRNSVRQSSFRWELGREHVGRCQRNIFQADQLQTNQGLDSILTTRLHLRISLADAGHLSCGSAPCSGSFRTCICICLGVNLTRPRGLMTCSRSSFGC